MANLGIGYEFSARDTDLKNTFKNTEKNLDSLNGLLDDQNEKGSKAAKVWGRVGEKIKQFNIAAIAGNVSKLTGETGRLTNGLEGLGVQAATAAKPILAQMDLTSREHKKMMGRVTGMSIGLNVGAEAIAETLRSIHTAGKDAKSGIDAMSMSEKEWVKVTQTTGVTMEDFQAVLGNMIGSWDASPDAAAEMVDNMMAIGKAAGVGAVGLKGMKGQMDAVDTVFEKLPPSMARSADEISSLMTSTVALSGAFKDLGETNEKSMELAQNTGMMFAEQSVAIKRAELGLGSYEDSPLFKWMTMLGVSSREAISIIDEGSVDAVKGSKRIQAAMQDGIARGTIQADSAMAGLNDAMGQSAGGLAYLVQNLDAGADALTRVDNLTVKGAGALAKYGNQAHSSGRTLQESFDLAKESFQTQFRSIGRADVKGLVGKQMQSYRRMGKTLKDLGKHDTFGPIIKKLSILNQMGSRGVFLSFAEDLGLSTEKAMDMGVGLELAMDTVGQLTEEFEPLMSIMGKLGPLGTIGAIGGVAAMFMMDPSDAKEILGSFYPIFEGIKAKIEEFFEGDTWAKMVIGMKSAMKKGWEMFKKVIPWKAIEDAAKKVGGMIVDGILSALKGMKDNLGVEGLAMGGALAAAMAGSKAFGPKGILAVAMLGAVYGAASGAAAEVDKAQDEVQARERERARLKRKQERRLVGGAGKKEEEKITKVAEMMSGGPKSQMAKGGQEDDWWRMQAELSIGGASAQATGTADVQGKVDHLMGLATANEKFVKSLAESRGELSNLMSTVTTGHGRGGGGTMQLFSKEKAAAYVESLRAEFEKIATSGTEGTLIDSLIRTEGRHAAGLSVTAFDTALAQVEANVGLMSAGIDTVLAWEAENIYIAGQSVPDQFADGVESGVKEVTERIEGSMGTMTASVRGHSLPKEGPLSGAEKQNASYFGGRSIMEQFAAGITDSTTMVTDAVNAALEESVIKTFEAYKLKVEELGKQKNLLNTVSRQIVGSFGMDIKSAEFEGEKINIEKRMKAMINIPGMAGVVAAVVKSGADSQVILKKIYEQTKRSADTLESVTKQKSEGQAGIVLAS